MDNYMQPFVALCLNALFATMLREYGGFDMSKAKLQNWDAVSIAHLLVGTTPQYYRYRHSTNQQ
jgi:hypothetical protein